MSQQEQSQTLKPQKIAYPQSEEIWVGIPEPKEPVDYQVITQDKEK
mgnify:CR=1 FL=1